MKWDLAAGEHLVICFTVLNPNKCFEPRTGMQHYQIIRSIKWNSLDLMAQLSFVIAKDYGPHANPYNICLHNYYIYVWEVVSFSM